MSDYPTIDKCWQLYLATRLVRDLDPVAEEEFKTTFYCGFESALAAVEALAEILHRDGFEESELAWDTLSAEFEKFAAEKDCGEVSTHH